MDRIGEIIHRKQFVIEHGCHVRHGIIIVLEGRFSCAIGQQSFTAEKNSICVFPKGVLFDRTVLEPIRCVYLQFDEFPWPLDAGLMHTSDPQRTENTIAHLARAVEEENGELVEHFLRDLYLMHRPPAHRPVILDEVVSKAVAFMSREYSQQITLDTLARECAISKQALIRKFRSSTGTTPMQYLLSVRIAQSKRLLRDTNLSAGQIARHCGFENVYYFSNCFLKASGIRPSEYRRTVGL